MTSHCPVLRPSCNLLNASTNTSDTNSSVCAVSGYDAYSTNCSCTIYPNSGPSSRRRRLSDTLAKSGVLDVASSSIYLASDFVDTFESAEDFDSLEDVKRVLIVIVLFSALWGGGLLLILSCTWRRTAMEKVYMSQEAELQKRAERVQGSRSLTEVRRYLTDYVVTTFPSVFSNKPFFSRLYGEIRRHHRYIRIFTAEDGENGDKQRILTGAYLLSMQTMLMFSLALLYDVQGPADDGSCVHYTDETACLDQKSPFDSSLSYCEWDNNTASCSYQEPTFTFQVLVYIAVIIALIVAALQYPIDRMFELLSAPVADAEKTGKDTALSQLGRRMSNMARRASNAVADMATAARGRFNRARQSVVGTITRKIPASTETAHTLAQASIQSIAHDWRTSLQERQMARLRELHHASHMQGDGDSAASSNSDSDSEGGDTDLRHVADVEVGVTHNNSTPAGSASISLNKLSLEMGMQRLQLLPAERTEFDAQWGLDSAGEFLPAVYTTHLCRANRLLGPKEGIQRELLFVYTETAKKEEKLSMATDAHVGVEILHLFVRDLLGRSTPAAIIFDAKTTEDFEHTTVVSSRAKYLAGAALVGINVFFVYFAMLTGFRRGLSWQRMYLLACLVQFAVEILLFETMECVWIHCAIPALVRTEVRAVGDSIIEIVQQLCDGSTSSSAASAKFLNAPEYLFVSTNLAKKFPLLMESVLVQAYSSHLPGELSKLWRSPDHPGVPMLQHRHPRGHTVRHVAMMSSLLAVLQVMGTAPLLVHRMFVRFLQPFVFTAIVLLLALVASHPAYIGAVCAVCAVALVYAAYRHYQDTLTERTALPVHDMAIAAVTAEYQCDGNPNTPQDQQQQQEIKQDTLHLPAQEDSCEVTGGQSSPVHSNSSQLDVSVPSSESCSHCSDQAGEHEHIPTGVHSPSISVCGSEVSAESETHYKSESEYDSSSCSSIDSSELQGFIEGEGDLCLSTE